LHYYGGFFKSLALFLILVAKSTQIDDITDSLSDKIKLLDRTCDAPVSMYLSELFPAISSRFAEFFLLGLKSNLGPLLVSIYMVSLYTYTIIIITLTISKC